MKRNKKLAIDILRQIRSSGGPWRAEGVLKKLDTDKRYELTYHIEMLKGAGFVAVHEDGESLQLTWEGHEELDRRGETSSSGS